MSEISSKEIEIVYSKKQINPLIEKFHIKPETNSKFKEIIKSFPQTNYQIWALKAVFNKITSFENILSIKMWADNNQHLIKKLIKSNIVSYTTTEDFHSLSKEINGLTKLACVKRNVDKYNTEQRKIFAQNVKLNENGLEAQTDIVVERLAEMFKEFEKMSDTRQHNFITKCSAVYDFNRLFDLLGDCLKDDWMWDKEDLLDFVSRKTKDTEIAYNKDNMVILNIKSFDSSKLTCGGDKSSWCITQSDAQFNNYVLNHNGKRKQFFMFNFDKAESDDLSKIGFTVDVKEGIVNAHSMKNACLMSSYSYNGNRTDIFKILADFRVPFSKILDCKLNTAYDWKKTDLKKYAKDLANTEVVYDKNNVVILKTYSRDSFESLCRHTYIKGDKISLGKEGYMLYIVFDFNKEKEDDNSIVAIQAVIDEYKTETLTNLFNLYGLSVDKKEFLPSIKVKEEEFVKQIELDNNVLLHKLIDEEREEDAIKLVKESKDLDVNFAFNERIPVFSAVQKGLYKLCNVIINTEKYDSEVLDDFNEKFLTHIGYQAAFYDESEEEGLNSVFHTIFDCGKFDFTQLNESNENILNIISGVGFLNWFSKELIKRQEMDINNVNDTDETILSNAMADNNKELVEFICTRPDLTIRDIDRETAKEQGYNLEKLVKPNKDFFREERKVSKRVVKSVSSMEEISDEDKECLKKVYSLVFGK